MGVWDGVPHGFDLGGMGDMHRWELKTEEELQQKQPLGISHMATGAPLGEISSKTAQGMRSDLPETHGELRQL